MRGNTGLIIGGLGILAMVLLGSPGLASQSSGDQSKPASGAWMLPDTSAQQAVVRQYLELLADGHYADAWRLLSPSRQSELPLDKFTAAWQARGRVIITNERGPYAKTFLWPAAVDQVRASFMVRESHSGGGQTWGFTMARSGGAWRIADEQFLGPLAVELPPVSSPTEAVERAVRMNYGSIWLPSISILYNEPYDDGRVIIFRVLNPLLEPKEEGPRSTAIMYYLRPDQGGWTFAGGGSIGTIVVIGVSPVACAWTWLRFPVSHATDAPATAAFYCTIEDPRVATIELQRVDGAVQRANVLGKQAVVFPYAASFRTPWPAQHPAAIRLFDATGQPLDLPTSPVESEV
ncbi:MAG TPA: hypothetical protein VFS96_07830 [Nitrolancea sp.]|nr:hypothetical protein [Nitrolancea sp.]